MVGITPERAWSWVLYLGHDGMEVPGFLKEGACSSIEPEATENAWCAERLCTFSGAAYKLC